MDLVSLHAAGVSARPFDGTTAARVPRALAWLALAIAGVLTLTSFSANGPAESEQDQAREYALKGAMLEKFMKYIEWPAEALGEEDAPVRVGVYGKDPFGKTLDAMFEDKYQQAHPIQVVRITKPEELSRCIVVFVPKTSAEELPKLAQQVKGQSVLLVGESKGFATSGGTINFYTEDKKLRFEMNPAEAKRAKVKISSSLLKLARIVEESKK